VTADPHGAQPVLHRGPEPSKARLAAILVHGRGASAEDILSLAQEFSARDVAYYAPQAAGNTWYPYSFLAPLADNQPGITSGLKKIDTIIASLREHDVGPERLVILGFSQGACLSLEYAARHAARFAGVVGLSGGLIGPSGTPRDYNGSFEGTPVFVGCSDIDPHIPLARVRETAEVFAGLNAQVDMRIYPRMGHTVNRDELDAINALLG
jgi:predicted esterase